MTSKIKKHIRAHGIKVLLSSHPEIRRLKRNNFPTSHGNKFWTSSWLLMDYFEKNGMPEKTRIMELGCGWGLAGIYCAKNHGASVTGIDIDREVFPFLSLHAKINNVDVNFLRKGFNSLTLREMKNIDIIIGADICFWDEMVDPLKKLINRALKAGVKLILIADPVRSPFEKLGGYFLGKQGGEVLDWSVRRPRKIRGQILKISKSA